MNVGDYQTAALAIYALKQYGPEAEKTGTDAVIAKAGKWLEHVKPANTQDRAFHLLGLAWGNGTAKLIKDAARDLARLQRTDGGWNQLPEMASDAYATGQAPDGSWHVQTRAIWLQPYFESGFPYGRDQFISTAGTAWAAMALAPAAEPQRVSDKRVNLFEALNRNSP